MLQESRVLIPDLQQNAFNKAQRKSLLILERFINREIRLKSLLEPEYHEEVTGRLAILSEVLHELRGIEYSRFEPYRRIK